MNDTSVFFCVMVVLVLLVGIVILATSSSSTAALDVVAKKWDGYVEPGGPLASPYAFLKIDGSIARLHYTRQRNIRYTHLTIPFPDRNFRVEIHSQNLVEQFRRLLGMEDIEIGSPQFDDAFVINGNSPKAIRDYFTADVQTSIFELARFAAVFSLDLHLSIQSGVLRITKHAGLSSVGELTRFVALCEMVYHTLAYSSRSGIEFITPVANEATVGQAEETQCQVCGEPLVSKIVYCASCKTPHHADCWEYFGSCAVYGCGQKKHRTKLK
ncbi:RING finger protein [Anatilimnocola sp. NA78]|uniref:RING finger protein n=1 Tax=Anatilimnocola sp. NA78 TaxID=3415683 RepID=UPI003CE4AF7F